MMLGFSYSADARICQDVTIVSNDGSQKVKICGENLQEICDKALKIADTLNK